MAPVDVHRIADGLEGEEADPYGQENLFEDEISTQGLVGPEGEGVLDVDFYAGEVENEIGHEVGIFEITEYQQVHHHRQGHQRLPLPGHLIPVDGAACK